MFDWIARNWQRQWLGNLAWWQTLAGLAQALLAVLLFKVSRDLVRLGAFQSRLQKQSLKIGLFQKRLDVFPALMGFQSKPGADAPNSLQLLRDTNTTDLLFGPEVEAFIQKVYSHAIKIHSLERDIGALRDPERRMALVGQLNPLAEWLPSFLALR